MHAGTGLEQVHRNQPDDERDRGQHFEIDQRLKRDAADLGHIGHAGDAVDDSAKNDRRDKDADRLDEGAPERLHTGADVRVLRAERDTRHHRHQYQKPELQIERQRRCR